MANTVAKFIDEMYIKGAEEYENSRGYLSKFGSWVASFFYQRPFQCHVDLSESLFNRLKQEEGIQTRGEMIGLGGIVVGLSHETNPDFKITAPEFSNSYDSKHHGLKPIIESP